VHGVTGDVEPEHLAHAGVVGHVVQPGGLHDALHLGGGVGVEVGEQVAAGDDVLAAPGLPELSASSGPPPETMAWAGFIPPTTAARTGLSVQALAVVSAGAPSNSRAIMMEIICEEHRRTSAWKVARHLGQAPSSRLPPGGRPTPHGNN
jgi:hypothetical protein